MVNKFYVFVCIACLPSIAHASYSDGFWAFIVIFFLLPIIIGGMISTLVMCSKGRFKNNRHLLRQYSYGWGIFSLVATALCKEEFVYGVIFFSLFMVLVLGPAIYQYKFSE